MRFSICICIFIYASTSGGAAHEGLVGELERQERAAGAVQCGHQQRPGGFPHQLPPTTPGYPRWRCSQHWGRLLSPEGMMANTVHVQYK